MYSKLAKSTKFTIMPMHGTTKVSNQKKYTQIIIMHYTQKGKQTFLKTISEKHLFFLTSHEKQATERMVCSGELPPPTLRQLRTCTNCRLLEKWPCTVLVRWPPPGFPVARSAGQRSSSAAAWSAESSTVQHCQLFSAAWLTGFLSFSPPVGIRI